MFSGYRRSTMLAFIVLLFSACGDGGCGGCAGCDVAPIPGGFPIAERIEGAAQLRMTDQGLSFLESNADTLIAQFLPGGLDFPIDEIRQSGITICRGSDCQVHAEIAGLSITPAPPNALDVRIDLIMEGQNRAGMREKWEGTCDLDLDTRGDGRDFVSLKAKVIFQTETASARAGYTKVVVEEAGIDPAGDLQNDDVRISGGILNACRILDLGFIKSFVLNQVTDPLTETIQEALDSQLCTTPSPEVGCPTGTFAVGTGMDAVCRYGNDASAACVPVLLGTDGQGDLGAAFLGGFSPGVHAPGQFLLAAGGDGEAVNNGLTLDFYGGFLSTSADFQTSPGHNSCVPVFPPPALPSVAPASAFRVNTIPGLAEAPHVGIGISEKYLNHAGYGMFDGGLFCIGTGTALSQQISAGLFSLLIPSLRAVIQPENNAAIGIALRPQNAPVFEIGAGTGEDPVLNMSFPQLSMDFYVFASERYVRFMTFTSDIGLNLNLVVENGQVVPKIESLTATNSVVSNDELLLSENGDLAPVIESVLTTFAGMATGGLSGFDLPEVMGIKLNVPAGGIRGIEEGDDEFLAIFANMEIAPNAVLSQIDTHAELVELHTNPEAMTVQNWKQGELPYAVLKASAEGPIGVEYEYSARLNGIRWTDWSTDPNIVIQDEALLFQRHHDFEVRARIAGDSDSIDPEPAHLTALIDILPPDVKVLADSDTLHIDAWDVLTKQEDLLVRFRSTDTNWSEWLSYEDAKEMPVANGWQLEVKDEAGNVQTAEAALIRGIPNPAGGGCACDVAASSNGALPLGGLLFVLLGSVLVARRRRRLRPTSQGKLGRQSRTLTILSVFLLGACDCCPEEPMGDGGTEASMGMCSDNSMCTGGLCCVEESMCVPTTSLCMAPQICEAGSETLDADCNATCNCVSPPPIEPGILGSYLDVARNEGQSFALSGYSTKFGDLVVGTMTGADVAWELVDGFPDSPVTGDPTGWRNGVGVSGDDVGRWTSIVANAGVYQVAYHDRTNRDLKFAAGPGTWNSHVIDAEGDAGRYANMMRLDDGSLFVAYLSMVPAPAAGMQPTSRLRVATSSNGSPSATGDWQFADVTSSPMACRPALCPAGSFCLETGMCAAADDGTALPDDFVEDMPPAVGLYPAIAKTASGVGIVFYDRIKGDVMATEFAGGAFSAPVLIDGYSKGLPDVGDCGIGSSLFVDGSGTWHVSYVDAAEETLRYATLSALTVQGTQLVDDGSTDGVTQHPDGRHLVGDDSSIAVTASGKVRIVYQDATSQRMVVATNVDDAWTIQTQPQDGSAGYWIEQLLQSDNETSDVVEHWLKLPMGEGGVRLTTLN